MSFILKYFANKVRLDQDFNKIVLNSFTNYNAGEYTQYIGIQRDY